MLEVKVGKPNHSKIAKGQRKTQAFILHQPKAVRNYKRRIFICVKLKGFDLGT